MANINIFESAPEGTRREIPSCNFTHQSLINQTLQLF